jgi:hypothetical protein
MATKSADLFGTFLDTLSSSSVKRSEVAENASPGRARAELGTSPPHGMASSASAIADRILEKLSNRGPEFSATMSELLSEAAENNRALLLEAVRQLQSFELVTNKGSVITLSGAGKDLANPG